MRRFRVNAAPCAAVRLAMCSIAAWANTAAAQAGPLLNQERAATHIYAGLRATARRDARFWLDRAMHGVGVVASSGGPVLHYKASTISQLADQSDRSYPPFMEVTGAEERWFDPATGVERTSLAGGRVEFLTNQRASYRVSGDDLAPARQAHAALFAARGFDPWEVIQAWSHDPAVRVTGAARYRDFERMVLSRPGALGLERLYLDTASGIPVKLETTEWSYFLGPVHVAYVYSSWFSMSPSGAFPAATIRQSDGLGEEIRSVLPGDAALVPRDSAPRLALPDTGAAMPVIGSPPFGDEPTDTVRVGSNVFLLTNHAFTSAVALVRDTVYLFDAPAGEQRAQRDSVWIARLFPGIHPVALVLPSTVWPHIAGLRYWVAAGARIVGPALAEPLIAATVRRRWVERPDRLERLRETGASPILHFVAVRDSISLAGGRLSLYSLHGAANEGVLMAYLPIPRFLWASDRLQKDPSFDLYASELVDDVRRLRLTPLWTSGPHYGVVVWDSVIRRTQGHVTLAP